MTILKLVVFGVLIVLFMPYITNFISLVSALIPSVLVDVISLALIVCIIMWVVKE